MNDDADEPETPALDKPGSQATAAPPPDPEPIVAPDEPAGSPATHLEPVVAAARVESVDVLRGVALLGILTMNVVAFGWPLSGYDTPVFSGGDTPANRVAWLTNMVVFAGKMMSLFAMLFGAGLVLLGERADARGVPLRGVYYRRILVLLGFGLIHSYLIWEGDILYSYAICGLFLYPLRYARARTLLVLGTTLIAIGLLLSVAFTAGAGYLEAAARRVEASQAAGRTPDPADVGLAEVWTDEMRPFFRPTEKEVAEELAIYSGGYLRIVRHRAPLVFMIQTFVFLLLIVWDAAGKMLLGMGLMKLGVFAAARSPRLYYGLMAFGYGVGLPLTIVGSVGLMRNGYDEIRALGAATAVAAGMLPVALGHVGLIMRLVQAGVLPALQRRLAAVGRMALTNYLAQSLIGTTLFYGYGFGLIGRLDRVGLWGVVLAIWAVQLAWSPWWLARFRYGPAEWLWRWLTYGHRPAWRAEPRAATA